MSRAIRVVAAVLVRDGRVLVAQRAADKSQGGLWELPGGKVEAGEGDDHALIRELEEELGVRVEVLLPPLAEAEHTYPDKTIRLVALECRLSSGEPVAHEHQALRWLRASDLAEVQWAPADVPLLAAVRPLLS